MSMVRFMVLVSGLAFFAGCGGDTPKGAIPSTNAAAKPPSGVTTVTNADGTTSETSSAGKIQDPVE